MVSRSMFLFSFCRLSASSVCVDSVPCVVYVYSQLRVIEEVQSAINNDDAILVVLDHIADTRDDTVHHVLAFIAAMLFGGNEHIQVNATRGSFGAIT